MVMPKTLEEKGSESLFLSALPCGMPHAYSPLCLNKGQPVPKIRIRNLFAGGAVC